MTPHIIDLLTVEVLVPPATTSAFVLDESTLNETPLGTTAEALAWQPILARARQITTRRGGSADKITSAIEVGTAQIELVNAPAMRIRPSTPIRIHTTTGVPIFTGEVTDLNSSTLREVTGATVEVYTITTITAVDQVSTLANTKRYGAIADTLHGDDTPFGYEPFEQRIHRLLRRTGLPYNVAPNVPIEVDSQVGTTRPVIGPTEQSIRDVWRASPATTFQVVRLIGPGDVTLGWLPWASLPVGTTPAGAAWLARTLYGLHPGATYRVAVNRPAWTDGSRTERLGVGILGQDYTPYTARAGVPAYHEFVATATEHDLIIVNADPVTVTEGQLVAVTVNSADPWAEGFVPAQLTMWVHEQRMPRGQSWQCQSIVYEGTLADHLDIAVNTVRGRWWVDRHGTIQAAREEGWVTPAVILTDHTNGRPAHRTTYAWTGTPGASTSTESVDGTVVRTNHVQVPRPRPGVTTGWAGSGVGVLEPGPDGVDGFYRATGQDALALVGLVVPLVVEDQSIYLSLQVRSSVAVPVVVTSGDTVGSVVTLTPGEWSELSLEHFATGSVTQVIAQVLTYDGAAAVPLPEGETLDVTMAYVSTDPGAYFDGDTPDVLTGTISYVAVGKSFDTQRIVNDVTVRNHGSAIDPDTGRRVSADATFNAVDVTSRATNGARVAEVEASIYSPDDIPESIYRGSGHDLARSYARAFARADDRISTVRVRTSQHLPLITGLDIYDPVTAENADTITEARIISIEHEITPEDWHTTLNLIERN